VFTIHDRPAQLCDGVSRRDWLKIGGLGLAGLSLPALLQSRAEGVTRSVAAPPAFGRAKSCIVLFFLGGPPQHETWDPKPAAPVEVRGELSPIASAVPGISVGELMPRTARLTNKIAILRAVATNDSAHSSSGYYLTTGVPHRPMGVENAKTGAPNDWPCLGAIVRRLWSGPQALPAAITLPEQSANDGNLTWPGQDAGFLGRATDPWLLNCDPSAANFSIPGLALPAEVPALRFDARRALVGEVNRHLDEAHRAGRLALHGAYSRQAIDLLSSPQARRAFDIEQEAPRVRDRFGRSKFGQSVLLARRLVESGVPLIRVNWSRVAGAPNNGHWDTHSANSAGLRALMPIMDRAYSALLEDLQTRGLLDETLVVWMGEFGRTPRLNGAAGRDHWGSVFSIGLAGGGIQGGIVHGASDSIGAYPRDGRVLPPDLTATIFHLLGIRPDAEVTDPLGRPLAISRGEVIRAIL
jgi:hypothetical protein